MTTRGARLAIAALLAAVLAACQATAPPTGGGPKKDPGPSARKSATPRPGATPAGNPGSFVGPGTGPGVVTPTVPLATPGPGPLPTAIPPVVGPGGGLISDQGGALTGKVKIPATLVSDSGGAIVSDAGGAVVSNNGAAVISNNGSGFVGRGYRLQALDERTLGGVTVALVLANGDPVKDAAGQPITAVTAADGSYRLPYAGSDTSVLALARLPAGLGEVVAFVPKGKREAAATIDLDTTSTLTMGYVLSRYVRRDQAILERLTPELEAETRSKLAAPIAAAAPPTDLTPAQVVARVDGLRRTDAAVDGQMERVRKALLAGLSEQGVGRAALDIEVAPTRAVRAPTGELVWADVTSARVFRKDAEGKIAVVAGLGTLELNAGKGLTREDPTGDGGPATAAPILPHALGYAPDGTLIIADSRSATLRRVDDAGVISTFASLPKGTVFTDMEGLPDGSFLASTPSAIYTIDPKGVATLFAGEATAGVALLAYLDKKKIAGDGGPAAAARFGGIIGLGWEPKTGAALVWDFPGQVRRIGKDLVEHLAGDLNPGAAAGDGGPVASAKFGASGDVMADAAGRLWIADGNNHRIRVVEDGVVSTVAGTGAPGVAGDGGPALSAAVGLPLAFAFGQDGEVLIVADGLVRRLAGGKLTTEVGALDLRLGPRPPAEVQLLQPYVLRHEPATDAILVVDSRHIWRWRLAANTFEIAVSRGAGGGAFATGGSAKESYLNIFSEALVEPDGALVFVALDPVGTSLGRIGRVRDDVMTPIMGETHKTSLDKLPAAVDAKVPFMGRLARLGDTFFLGAISPPAVYAFKEGGAVRLVGGTGANRATPGPFADYKIASLGAFEAGPDGALYLGDAGRVVRVDVATGAATIVAGKSGGTPPADGVAATEARLGEVGGLAWDAAGRLYLADAGLAQVWRVEPVTGALTLVAGKGGPNLAGSTLDDGLSNPMGLAFDDAGDLYVADRVTHQVKRIPADRLP